MVATASAPPRRSTARRAVEEVHAHLALGAEHAQAAFHRQRDARCGDHRGAARRGSAAARRRSRAGPTRRRAPTASHRDRGHRRRGSAPGRCRGSSGRARRRRRGCAAGTGRRGWRPTTAPARRPALRTTARNAAEKRSIWPTCSTRPAEAAAAISASASGERGGDRLFDEDMPAGGERRHGELVVEACRGGDDHGIRRGDGGLGAERRGARLGGDRRGAGGVGIGQPDQADARVGGGLQGMEAAEMTDAEDGEGESCVAGAHARALKQIPPGWNHRGGGGGEPGSVPGA